MTNGGNNSNNNRRKGQTVVLRKGRQYDNSNIQSRLQKFKPKNNQQRPVLQNNKVKLTTAKAKKQIIAQNLSNLRENIRKKKLAQERYYQTHVANRSPLTRNNSNSNAQTNNINHNNAPIRNRLGGGNKKINLNYNNNNRRQPMQQQVQQQHPQNRQNKVQKILNLRARRTNQNNPQQQQQQQRQQLQHHQNQPRKSQKIVLRRGRRNNNANGNFQAGMGAKKGPVNPVNYTVQVVTNSAAGGGVAGGEDDGLLMTASQKHHLALNPRLQAEIKMIQRTNPVHEIVPNVRLPPLSSGVTKTTLHERFSHI